MNISQSSYLDYVDIEMTARFSRTWLQQISRAVVWDSDHSRNLSVRSVSQTSSPGSKWQLDDHSIPKKIDCSQYREIYDSVIGLQTWSLHLIRVFFLAVFITMANVIFGLLPAFLGSRVEPAATLKEQSFHGEVPVRAGGGSDVAQVVLSLSFLSGPACLSGLSCGSSQRIPD